MFRRLERLKLPAGSVKPVIAALLLRPHDPSAFCCGFNHASERDTAISHSGVPPFWRSFSRRLCVEQREPYKLGRWAIVVEGALPSMLRTLLKALPADTLLSLPPAAPVPCPPSGKTLASASGSATSARPSTPMRICGIRFAKAVSCSKVTLCARSRVAFSPTLDRPAGIIFPPASSFVYSPESIQRASRSPHAHQC
jgi:hypothetical protein